MLKAKTTLLHLKKVSAHLEKEVERLKELLELLNNQTKTEALAQQNGHHPPAPSSIKL